jgi:hypothetical protein
MDGLSGVQTQDSVVVTGIGGVAESDENGNTELGQEIAWTG